MSRYLLLVILNTPLIIAAMMNTVVGYKLGHMGRRRFFFGLSFWLLIFAALVFVKPIYSYLFSNNLTQTEPLSLFDVMQITGIIFTLFIANRAYGKVDVLERKVQDLHQELSIKLSEKNNKKTRN
ncbi:hypothetical protein A3F65_00755 [Candidatus Saccharibacteria bacterium RIFCSPHIGHO2_12_FULL_47_16b]|nr:MAG: hypothetical protein A3F65_00755 [Candidatus Saccharibacteria bacterium RIFCSPHIGHO2_12_FULL_47_16b]